ncbi:uncharacterized protein [Apostichopus japonicus]|uniref:uncharacterized protein isoform X2 n=1 Tax=Stichopus japonicus TaxID=307972 RepID=UPI003AB5CDBD
MNFITLLLLTSFLVEFSDVIDMLTSRAFHNTLSVERFHIRPETMDEFVKEKLAEWNLSSLNEIFEENMIDEEAFLLLDEAALTEMVKAVGPRKKFLKKLQEEQTLAVMNNSLDYVPDLFLPTTSTPKRSSLDTTSDDSSLVENSVPLKKSKSYHWEVIPAFSVRTILESHSSEGGDIIKELESGVLSRKRRLKMVQILVAYMIENFGDRPTTDIKVRMARAIIQDFPVLKDEEGQGFEAWYTPGKGLHSASGWLEERLRNVRRRTSGTKRTAQVPTVSKMVKVTALPDCSVSETDDYAMKEWLKNHIEPLSQVHEFMEKTTIKRAEWIRANPGLSISSILKEYPRLIDIPGMIEMDFRRIYPDVADNLFMQWTPPFVEKVLQYADLQGKWQSYLNVRADRLDSDEKKSNIGLSLLPCILPSGRKGKKRCSIDDAMKSFVDVQPVGTNMPKYLEEVDNRQPFVLIMGDRDAAHQIFVVADGHGLEQQTLLKALDVCFKLFYVLDLHYPWQCAVTWEFVQKVLYGLDSKVKSKTSPAVIAMRAALKAGMDD